MAEFERNRQNNHYILYFPNSLPLPSIKKNIHHRFLSQSYIQKKIPPLLLTCFLIINIYFGCGLVDLWISLQNLIGNTNWIHQNSRILGFRTQVDLVLDLQRFICKFFISIYKLYRNTSTPELETCCAFDFLQDFNWILFRDLFVLFFFLLLFNWDHKLSKCPSAYQQFFTARVMMNSKKTRINKQLIQKKFH